jgi:hypothetical protein
MALAQATAPVVAIAEPDAARLASARQLLDQIMPPATREGMIQSMLTPMQANMRHGLEQSEGLQKALRRDPKAKAAFDRFLDKQEARTSAVLRESLPGMIEAMARAYARRFDVAQLDDIKRFFATPTGQAYMKTSFSIMADPDIAAWQRKLMSRAMTQMQDDIAAMAKDIEATQQDKK